MIMLISALLLGSSLGTTLAKFIIKSTDFRLVDMSIPGISADLALYKTFDQVEFVMTIFATFCIFLVNHLIENKYKLLLNTKKVNIVKIFFLIFAVVIFIQTHFVTSSGKIILGLIGAIETFYFLANKFKIHKLPKDNIYLLISNGALTGFWGLLVLNSFTTSVAIPIIFFFFSIFLYLLHGNIFPKAWTNPAHLLFSLSIIAPTNRLFLFLLGGIAFLTIYVTRQKLDKYHPRIFQSFLYSVVLIAIIYFNPLYYAGNLDSVEEGFWLAWLQRMINKEYLYKDVAAFQPPLIAWGMYAFTSFTGFTVRNVRLFLHLGQILSAIIFFYFSKNLLSKKASLIASFLVFLSVTYTPVRNNVEIRTGVGLIALLFWFYFVKTKNYRLLFLSGILSSVSFFVSIEVGISAILTIALVTFLTGKSKIKEIINYTFGLLAGSLPIILYLTKTSSLTNFISYSYYYSSIFTKGYFNTEVERAISVSFLRWHLIWQYLSSTAWVTELVRMVFLATLIVVIKKVLVNTKSIRGINFKSLTNIERLLFATAIFGLLLFRSALGRSDYYHVLFVLIPAIPLYFHLVEKAKSNLMYVIASTFLIFVVFPKTINENYLSNLFFKFTTYAKIVDEYKSYDIPRSQILVGTEVKVETVNDVVNYIHVNTTSEDSIFVFPWNPELYFLTDTRNATSFDTPYSFWTNYYQDKMVDELKTNNPKYIVLNNKSRFGELGPGSLSIVNDYIGKNYRVVEIFYPYDILIPAN